ncbi:MAG: hypothetical protein JWO30_1696 [Fibrobacteres bacterium]|nr:hypothetical protein [Fibrobacterota bacterium]
MTCDKKILAQEPGGHMGFMGRFAVPLELARALLSLMLVLALAQVAGAQTLRSRQDGLSATVSSSTAGAGNLHFTMYGRTFLWDNAANQKIPPVLPHLELNYGLTDYLDVAAGLNAISYVLQPGYMYARAKVTTPDNKSIRFLGFSQTVEAKKIMMDFFPSNGFRVKTEGFGPEGFILGNGGTINTWKFTTAADLELIRLSSWLPFKLYANLGWEGEFASYINEDNAAREKESKNKLKIPEQDFSLVPMSLGVELKTFNTDFFAEVEAQPFAAQIGHKIRADLRGDAGGEYTRFHVAGKTFDVHFMETPLYVNSGAKLKYKNGLELQGGLSWLLSSDRGPELGPCNAVSNRCLDGASDGYSPFFPQWKVFWLVRYPFWFSQPSSELYRSFLLKRYADKRKKVDLESTLGKPAADAEELDASERKKRLEERRKEADGKAVDLN